MASIKMPTTKSELRTLAATKPDRIDWESIPEPRSFSPSNLNEGSDLMCPVCDTPQMMYGVGCPGCGTPDPH
jgi:hypothetical protein